MSYADAQTSDLRLRIVQALAAAPAFTQNEEVLKAVLVDLYGHALSRDKLRVELAWLDEQGLLIIQKIGGQGAVWIASLLSRGEDCANGLAVIPGIARPRAGG
jgi:hypothetical protein